jgi:hypothetical protein
MRKHFISRVAARSFADAESIAPFWAKFVVQINTGWMVFESSNDARAHKNRKPNSERDSAVLPTQAEAIERVQELNEGVASLVERVRHTTGGKPDKWRKP